MPPVVTSLGILWERDAVTWNPVTLPGKHLPDVSNPQKPGVIDFAKQHAVYLLHRDRKIVYVGQTIHLGERLREHTRSPNLHNRWNRFSWFGFRKIVHPDGADGIGTLGDAVLPDDFGIGDLVATVEAILIESAEPRHNGMKGAGFNDLVYGQIAAP